MEEAMERNDLPAETEKSTPAWYHDINLEHAEKFISENLQAAARNVIAIGYYLKYIRDNQLYVDAGYQSIWDYAREKYGFSTSTASRYMSRNDRFSRGGNSPIMDERYREYSKSQLQEMLSLDEEQMAQVTPEMTAREIRELKRPREIPYYDIPGQGEMEDIPGVVPEVSGQIVLSASDFGVEPEEEIASDFPTGPVSVPQAGNTVLTAEDSAGTEEEVTVVATSQEIPEEALTESDLTGEEADTTDTETIAEEDSEETDLELLKELLERTDSLLKSNLSIPGIEESDIHIRRQKIEVAALAALLCDWEDVPEEPEEPEQPELPVFRNNDERKAWLENYAVWGLWYEDEHIGAKYYKYDFPDGTRLIVDEYRDILYGGREYKSSYLHLVGGPKERPKTTYGAPKWPYHDRYCRHPDNMTDMVEFLKDLQKRQKK